MPDRRQLAAERSRRWYRRRANGRQIIRIEVDAVAAAEALRAAGLLGSDDGAEALRVGLQRAVNIWFDASETG